MALYFVMGTAGELIKMYPLLHWAESHGLAWRCLHTGQSGVNFWRQWDDFSLDRNRAIQLKSSDADLQDSSSALKWFLSTLIGSPSEVLQKIENSGVKRSADPKDILFVHGDTLSTLVGAIWVGAYKCPLPMSKLVCGQNFCFNPFPKRSIGGWFRSL